MSMSSLSRRVIIAGAVCASVPALARASVGDRFRAWVRAYRRTALKAGIRPGVYDRAFRRVSYNAYVVEKDRRQAEFTLPLWDYLDRVSPPDRLPEGRRALARNGRLLAAIEARFGVPSSVVCAIWGVESRYGTHRGDIPVIESLSTLAFDGRRGRFYRAQLLQALKILQSGDARLKDFKGSWAGAMGHTQFIPTSWAAFAVDWTGDGRRDIWSDDPSDALASTAAYLARSGWRKGQPWGVEVRLPAGFDYDLARRTILKGTAEWTRRGVRDTRGRAVPDHGRAAILAPAGASGPAFMVFGNFNAILRYNNAEAYGLAVGILSDRLAGGGPLSRGWPDGDRELTGPERIALQRRLTALGHATGGIDGKLGPKSRRAIRAYQRSAGMVPDGRASLFLLERMR